MDDHEHAEWEHLLKTVMEPKTAEDGKERVVFSAPVCCAGSGQFATISDYSGRVICPVCTKYVRVKAGEKTPRHKEATGHRKFRY